MLAPRRLADFTADPHALILAALAGVVGVLGTLAAFVIVKLMAYTTNLVWFGTLDGRLGTLAHAPRTWRLWRLRRLAALLSV